MRVNTQQLNIYHALRWGFLWCCFLSLSACGFQLRGAYQLPEAMQQTFVQSTATTELVRLLKRQLSASGVELLDQPSDTAAVFRLLKETRSKRIVSVDTRGRAREYTLIYTVHFKVDHVSGFNMPEQSVSLERDFLFDTEDVLGKSRGEHELYQAMQDDIVRLIMLRLQSRTAS